MSDRVSTEPHISRPPRRVRTVVVAAAGALVLFAAAFAALVHALIPALFEKTASRLVRGLYERTHNRGN